MSRIGVLLPDEPEKDNRDFTELTRAIRELSARVERLEQRVGNEPSTPSRHETSAISNQQIPPSVSYEHGQLESRIASQWLHKIGVVAILFGVAYLLRYVFLKQWISAAMWIWLGVFAGLGVIVASEWFRRRGYRVLSLSLKSIGVGVSYLSLWAGLELYKLISSTETFAAFVALIMLTAVLALRESAEVLAALSLVAGFLTPLLISIPVLPAPLFAYIAVLDVATVFTALYRRWYKLLLLSLLGTIALAGIWYFNHYDASELVGAFFAATLIFALFSITAWLARRGSPAPATHALTAVELLNPFVYFTALYLLLHPAHHHALAIPALVLSALYFLNAWKTQARNISEVLVVYAGLAVTFLAISLAILLSLNWLSLGWFLEGATLMAVGFWRDIPWLRWSALLELFAAIIKAFVYDVWLLELAYRTLSFIGLGVLLLVLSFAYQRYGFSVLTKDGSGLGQRGEAGH